MKIESEKVDDLIKLFRAYFDGIIETIQIGDDGYQDSCIKQKEAAMEEILNWRARNMPQAVEKVKHYSEKELDEMKPHERWACELKSYLMRRVKADEQISEIPNDKLSIHIELYLDHPEAKTMQKIYYDKYVNIGIQTLMEVVEKIKEQRALAPQAKLF